MLAGIEEPAEAIDLPGAEGVRRIRNVRIPMRDNTLLAADLFVPADAAPSDRYPVVLEYIPYRKDDADLTVRRHYLVLPGSGYVVARVDVRGTGMSHGISVDEYTRREQQDGFEVVEWLASRPWCDGHVNMMGISYGGFTALQVAALAPPHLTSVIPVDFTDDRYTDDCHYRGGLLRLYYDVAYYGGFMICWNAMPPHARHAGPDWAQVWETHLEHNEPYLLQWYAHQTDGPYWRQGSVRDVADRIRCPVFMIGGWRDGYTNPPLRLFEALQVPAKVLMGPWNHAMPDSAIPGPRIEHLHEVVRWLDHWCKGRQTGIMEEPPIVVYEQCYQPPVVDRLETRGRWRAETAWPPPSAAERVFFLDESRLTPTEPDREAEDGYAYNPAVGTAGGLYSSGIQFGLPGDQRPDEALSLVYTSEPLQASLAVLGRPRVVLHAASTAQVMGFCVCLAEVGPDGQSHLVAKGMLNATRRNSMAHPEPMAPGQVYELIIDIDCTAWRFSPGNRIRLAVSSADWPNVWPTPQSGFNRILRGPAHPSRLILPTVSEAGSAQPPRFQPSPVARRRHSDASQPPTWSVSEDVLTGRKQVRLQLESRSRIDAHTVIEREASGRFDLDPADPGRACAAGRHLLRVVEFGQVVEGCSQVTITGGDGCFQIAVGLTVHVNGTLHFQKRWYRSIPRLLL